MGLRPGERSLAGRDHAVLELLAAPIGVAMRATALSQDLLEPRRAIVAAREEERRRLRRDLHDSLGPVLTGVAFEADAAGNLLHDPEQAAELVERIRLAATAALGDVRRIIYELRLVALDELGLVDAPRRYAQHL